jgi:regulator of replication initiation timing
MERTKTVLLLLVFLLAAIFLLRECNHSGEKTKLLESVMQYSDSVTYLRSESGKLISQNVTLTLENQKQLLSLLSENTDLLQQVEKFKSIKSVTTTKNVTIIVRDTIRLKDTIPCDFQPIKAEKATDNYYFLATITPNVLVIDSVYFPNEQSIIIGTKSMGFLKGKKEVVEIMNSNPLVMTTGAKSFVIDRKKKWYETTAAKVGLGIVIGTAINKR